MLTAIPQPADLLVLATQFRGDSVRPAVVNELAPQYAPGRVDRFWIGHAQEQDPHQIDADLRLVTRHAYWYIQRGLSVPDGALQEAAREFEAKTYPGVRRLIGSESFPGLDNDPRITILHGDISGVAGYVTSSDSYPRSVNPFSNERELVYLNLNAIAPGTAQYRYTLAHEFTHLVHGGWSIAEDTWVKEGLAELTAALVLGGSDDRVVSVGQADLPLTSWADADDRDQDAAAHYRVSELFLRYLAERFGVGALALLANRAVSGVAGWDAVLAEGGISDGFVGFFGQWAIANAVGSRRAPSVWPYHQISVDVGSVRPLRRGDVVSETVAQFGTDYFELADARSASIRIEADRTVPVLGADGVAPGTWVAARADGSVSHLTCALDLAIGPSPFLTYRLWYDIERDYDFAYVSVSPDGGQRWTLLRTPAMTTSNRLGMNLGAGYTGKSGASSRSRWVDEAIDLGEYAGRTVLVRFSYVTDDALVREGIAVDQVRAIASGASASEASCRDWSTHGWARVGSTFAQNWLVQVIEFSGEGARVRQLPMDGDGRSSWSGNGSQTERAIVAISAVTPGTLQRPTYRLTRE
jgi:hypothetical protein